MDQIPGVLDWDGIVHLLKDFGESGQRAFGCSFCNATISHIGEDSSIESLLGMEDPLDNGTPGIGLLTYPIKSSLKGFLGHQLGSEDHRRSIVLTPILVEKPSL
jgi:hypothetical protein